MNYRNMAKTYISPLLLANPTQSKPPPNRTGDTPSANVRAPEMRPCAVAACVGAADEEARELAVGKTAKAKMQPRGGRKTWRPAMTAMTFMAIFWVFDGFLVDF